MRAALAFPLPFSRNKIPNARCPHPSLMFCRRVTPRMRAAFNPRQICRGKVILRMCAALTHPSMALGKVTLPLCAVLTHRKVSRNKAIPRMRAALAFPWPNVAKQHHTCALPSPSFGVPSPSGTQAVGGPLRQTEVYSLSNAATWDSSSARLVAVHGLLKVRGG